LSISQGRRSRSAAQPRVIALKLRETRTQCDRFPPLSATYDDAGNATQLDYPGGTTIDTTFTANKRRDVISKGGSQVADYHRVGQRADSLRFETGLPDVVLSTLTSI
jgi:hypothetical protein